MSRWALVGLLAVGLSLSVWACLGTSSEPTLVPYVPAPGDEPLPTSVAPSGASFGAYVPPELPADVSLLYGGSDGLWLIEGQAEPRQLVEQRVNSWLVSPDRSQVVARVSTDAGETLQLVDLASGEARLLTPEDALPMGDGLEGPVRRQVRTMRWLPGTTTVLFTTAVPHEGLRWSEPDDLYALDVESGDVRQLLAPGNGGHPMPSPDGERIAITRASTEGDGTVIALTDLDGGDPRTVYEHPTIATDSEYLDVREPVWAADGESLLLALPGAAPGDDQPWLQSGITQVIRIPLDGAVPDQAALLEHRQFGEGFISEAQPLWSPDGLSVSYAMPVDAPPTPAPTNPADQDTSGEDPLADFAELRRWSDGDAEPTMVDRGPGVRMVAWDLDGDRVLYLKNDKLYVGATGDDPSPYGPAGDPLVRDAVMVDQRHVVYRRAGTGAHDGAIVLLLPGGEETVLAEGAIERFEAFREG